MKRYERVYAKIDLDAITDNMKRIREKLPEGVNLFAVVKADAYGHGAVRHLRCRTLWMDIVWHWLKRL